MTDQEEVALREELLADEFRRDRHLFAYTIDALLENAIIRLAIWPESNKNVAGVISGEINYDSLPIDEGNEFHKGGMFTEQQDIILQYWGQDVLCEAQDMGPCLKEKCSLYMSDLGPPVCREFKMAFKK